MFQHSSRLLFIALLAVVVASPYAIPVPWVALSNWLAPAARESITFLPDPVDNQTWFIIFSSTAIAAAAIALGKPAGTSTSRSRPNWITITATAFLLYTITRGLLEPNFQSAYKDLLLQASFLFLFISATLSRPTALQLRLFHAILCAALLPLAAIALLQNSGLDPLPYNKLLPGSGQPLAGKQLVASTFGHPNFMGSYFTPVIVLAAALTFTTARRQLRLLAAATVLLGLLALIIGGTRGPLLATLSGLLVLAATGRPRNFSRPTWLTLAAAVALLTGSVILIPALQPSFNLLDRLLAGKEIASRVFYWVVGLEMWSQSPILGIGTGQFDLQFWNTVSRMPSTGPGGHWHFVLGSVLRGVSPGQMHNDHLQALVETGLIGAALWVALWTAIICSRPQDKAIAAALAAIAVDAAFSFPLHLPCSGALFWIMLGLQTHRE